MHILLTGASGFVGSHVLRHLLMNTDARITCPVSFRHKGISPRISAAIDSTPSGMQRTTLEMLDLTAPIDRVTRSRIGPVDFILNVASESHVDRSITHPGQFISNNVQLILNMLDYAREVRPRMFLHMSTDEVYGPAYGEHRHAEGEPHRPSNPYSASKAAQEAIVFSYWRTYGVPAVITNTMNIIGETQDPEKFVPKTIRAIVNREPVTVHVSPEGVPGSRFYLHARNLADAWLHLIRTHTPQMYPEHMDLSRFNIVGEREVSNVELVQMIASYLGKTAKIEPVDFHTSRPGHDLRYALDGTKIAQTGWSAPVPLESSLERTVQWTLEHPEWMA